MTDRINITVIGRPVGKQRPRVTRTHTYTPKKTEEYEELIKWSYLSQAGKKKIEKDIPIKMTIRFYFNAPKSYPKYKKKLVEQGELVYTKMPDIDNLIKSVTDGLNGIAYQDDKQINTVVASKHYTTGKERAEVEIEVIDNG